MELSSQNESFATADAQVSTPSTDTQQPAGKSKARSPVEQRIVRGGILILFLLMLVELMAARSFNADFGAVQEALDSGPVTESDIQRMVTNHSSVSSRDDLTANQIVASREDVYRYRGLLKRRVLYVYYGVKLKGEKEAEVLNVMTEPTQFFELKRMTIPADMSGREEQSTEEQSTEEQSTEEQSTEEQSTEEQSTEEQEAVEQEAVEQEAVEQEAVEQP